MKPRIFARILFPLLIISGLGCATLAGPLTENKPLPTLTPNEDATAAAIVTDIGVPPSFVAWMSTANAIGTEGYSGNSSSAYDGKWIGNGVTSDSTEITISIQVVNYEITDVLIKYAGKQNTECQFHVSTEGEAKSEFLPLAIASSGAVQDMDLGLSGFFFSDNTASGSLNLTLTDQPNSDCNVEILASWNAEKQP
ncbi:MAG TPA: hypothetical protein PKE23_13395 [Anaerolineales bacterium]|nr:hypothetical protein [Anaerolineales bacterium]